MNNDYQILGIQPNASLKDIKLAYRKKASKIHPDVNPSPTAHEDFIALTEAYESALRGKTGRVYNESSRNYAKASSSYSEADLKEQARKRARRAAQMEYQEFIHSDYYKSKMSQYKTLEFWASLFFFIPFFTGQILLFAALKVEFIFSLFLLSLLTVPLLVNMIFILKTNKINQILSDTLLLIKTDAFITIMAVLFNAIIFINIGVATFIPMKIMITIYIIIPLLFQLFREISNVFIKEKLSIKLPIFLRSLMQIFSNLKQPFISIWGILPLTFSLFIILNVLFYQNKVEVTQNFDFELEDNGAMVKFEDSKYNHYWGICYFRDYDQFRNYHNRMTLKLKKGLFGIYVLEDYHVAN